jgi:hypothetical protein
MNEYSTVDTEIDIGGDVEELMMKVDKLTSENESLRKMMREKEHESSQKLVEMKMENEKLTGTNQSLEELLKTYQENMKSDAKSEIAELEEKIANLENILFLTEQSELNVKRQNQNLNMEISNLKLEINKLSINTKKEASLIPANQCGDNMDNLDAETKNLIVELMNEIEDLKKEKNEISEKAINLLTEKEVEAMELKEKIEELKKRNSEDTRRLQDQIRELKYKIEDEDKSDSRDEDNQSFNSEEAKILFEKYAELQDEFDEYKRISQETENSLKYKIENLQREIEYVENTYRQNIQDLESELAVLHSREEKYLYENESRSNSDNQILINEIEQMQNHIRNLEEIKEKLEYRNKEIISQLNIQVKNLDISCYELRNQKTQLENELKDYEARANKNIKEIQEKHKIEIAIKHREISNLSEKLETLTKENENIKKDYELLKKTSEKKKIEIIELNETMKKYKENNDSERKKLEEKYFILEKKFENERNALLEQIKEQTGKINSLKSQSSRRESELCLQLNSLSNMLSNEEKEKEDDQEDYKEQINQLNNKIAELNARILLYEKQKNDNELIIKENQKLKSDIKELKEMYEKQITQLQDKAVEMSNQLQSSRRKTSRNSIRGEGALSPQQMTMFMELQNTINRLNGEQKFLQQKIDLLNKEIESLRVLRENDVKYLKEELRAAEEQAINAKVSLATLAFEKDCEMIKFKKLCNKLKTKLTAQNNAIAAAKKK